MTLELIYMALELIYNRACQDFEKLIKNKSTNEMLEISCEDINNYIEKYNGIFREQELFFQKVVENPSNPLEHKIGALALLYHANRRIKHKINLLQRYT